MIKVSQQKNKVMKSKLLNAGLLACALLMTLSGCSSDETLTGDVNTSVKSMKINVSDGMFTSVDNNGAKTRATDSGTGTTFSSGDAIGIFAVKTDGTLALTNAKYTYNGTKWLNSDNTDILPYYAGAKYFAYYPYQESLANSKYDATKTTANTFFGTLISSWTPAADQSTQAKYTAQDLMVSMATVDVSTGSSSFTMSHQMSMVEMYFNQVHYTYNGANTYRFTFDATNKPFNIADGKYRFLVNPSAALSITGKNQYNSTDSTKTKGWKISGATPAASKYKICKYHGASASLTQTSRQNVFIGDATVGNYLYDDGTNGTTFKANQTVGIIYSSELTQAQYNAGCRHGRVLALKDAYSSTCVWSTGYTSPYADQTVHPYCQKFNTCFNDVSSGYDALSANSSYVGNSNNPAWKYCNTYNDGTTHAGSLVGRNWYLPSVGDWWDIMENLCTWTAAQKTTIQGMRTSPNSPTTLISGLSGYYSTFDTKLSAGGAGSPLIHANYYWSASEYNGSNAVVVLFYSNGVDVGYGGKAGSYRIVRAVLAY